MIGRRRSVYILLCGFFLLSLTLAAQVRREPFNTSTQLHGQVRLVDGQQAPPGIMVILEDVTGAEITRVITDARGKFDIKNIPDGEYVVSIRQQGYRAVLEKIDLTNMPSGSMQITLVPVDDKSVPPVPPGGPAATVSAKLPVSEEARKELKRGEELLFEKKDGDGSIPHFKKVVKIDPGYANGYILLGTAYMSAKRAAEAESAYREAVRLDPKSLYAQFALADNLYQQNKFAEAEPILKTCLQLNPKSVESHYELSRTYLALNQWQAAEPHAQEAIHLQPEFAPAHVVMGNILLKKRDAKAALAEYERYLQLAPEGEFAPQTRSMAGKIKNALAVAH